MNVLVVDDDEFIQKTISFHLLQMGHTLTIAMDGQSALESIKNNKHINALICDVNMPLLTGPGLILALKKFYPKQLPKIIIVSGIRDGINFLKKIDIPYDLYIEKPIDSKKIALLTDFLAH